MGVVPQLGSAPAAVAAPPALRGSVTTAAPGGAPTTAAPAATPPPTAPPATAPPTTARRTTVARAAATSSAPAPAAAAPSAAAAPASSVAPRLNPSSAQVQAAMNALKARNPLYGSLTEAQARQFANQVCSAFDAGQTAAQVQATAQAAASKVPLMAVPAADVRYAVRTAVQLFCPGYLPKLS
ncbi:MAG: hypothetical protein ABR511_14660 [Acidimicrobiales bacterium]